MRTYLLPAIFALHLGCSAAPPPSSPAQSPEATSGSQSLRIAIISYWELNSVAWDKVPSGSLLVLNPENGILNSADEPVSEAASWSRLAARLRGKGVRVLGYVPTGYFDHCAPPAQPRCQSEARIRRQVQAFVKHVPDIAGFFFDETSRKDGITRSYKEEYQFLRSLTPEGLLTVFNVGTPNLDAVEAAQASEHLVLYEAEPAGYDRSAHQIASATAAAQAKGVHVWHLLHTTSGYCAMRDYVAKMRRSGAEYGYVTDVGGNWEKGDPTWNVLPQYWDDELAAFSSSLPSCGRH